MDKKIVILNYTGNRSNWGCCATSEGLVKMIQGSIPGSIIDTIPLLDQDLFDEVMKIRYGDFLKRIMLNPNFFDNDKLLALAVKRFDNITINKIKDADIVFFQAEGTMTGQSFYAGIRLLLLPFIAKKVFNKPLISLNQTIFSADKTFIEIISSVYNLFDIVALREAASFDFVREKVVKNALLIPDAAFLTENEGFELPSELNRDGNYFAVTGAAKIEKLPIKVYGDLIKKIIKKFNLTPIFLLSTPSDQKLLEYFKEESYFFFDQKTDYQTITTIIKNCNFLIGGRYHMCLFSAVAETPFIPLTSNTFKNEGLTSLLKYPIEIFDFQNNHDEILIAVSNVLSKRKDYKRILLRGKQNVFLQLKNGMELITEMFSEDVITSERIEKVLHKDKYNSLKLYNSSVNIRKERWNLFFELNDATAMPAKNGLGKNWLKEFFLKIPLVSSILISTKYWLMEKKYLYRKKKECI